MRYSVFEQAAAEARGGINEIDTEIDRLKARRELLEVLESIARQLLTVVPMTAGPVPVSGSTRAGAVSDAPVDEQPPMASGLPER
jgi:hypothetical protein